MTFRITRKKLAGLTAVVVLGGGGAIAYAYYNATGSGTGSGTAGSASAPTVNQAAALCSDYSAWNGTDALGVGTCNLFPGTTQTVHLTVTNNGAGKQQVNDITLSGWSSTKSGCDSTTLPGSFTLGTTHYNQDLGAGLTGTSVDGTITFVDTNVDQGACQGATITFTYASS